MGFKKNRRDLKELFDEGLSKIKSNGEYQKIYNKWIRGKVDNVKIEIIEKVNSGIICLNNLGYTTAINDTSLCILNINKDYNLFKSYFESELHDLVDPAVKYVNEELGGINGKKVVLKYYDDELDEGKIPMLYERLITQDKVDLLVSPYTSPFLAAAPVVAKYDKMMFCIAADSYVANDQFGQNIVNIQMDDEWRGGMWWHDIAESFVHFDDWNHKGLEKPKTIAVLNLNISYGQEIAETVVPYWKNNGFDISGGNAADFNWGVAQYQPADINNASPTDRDWVVVWPEKYKEKDPVYPFPGW